MTASAYTFGSMNAARSIMFLAFRPVTLNGRETPTGPRPTAQVEQTLSCGVLEQMVLKNTVSGLKIMRLHASEVALKQDFSRPKQ